jgi:hypothetical protein
MKVRQAGPLWPCTMHSTKPSYIVVFKKDMKAKQILQSVQPVVAPCAGCILHVNNPPNLMANLLDETAM